MSIEEMGLQGINGKYKLIKVLGGGGCSNTFIGQLISDPSKVDHKNNLYIGICVKDDKIRSSGGHRRVEERGQITSTIEFP